MKNYKNILITGGAGFIGGALIRKLLKDSESNIFNIDKMGYASDLSSINSIITSKASHKLFPINLVNRESVDTILNETNPDLIIHLAAESHVDRSIDNPSNFVESNILGTFNLLESTRNYWNKLDTSKKELFRFHHVSTDEVFGTLGKTGFFKESSNYSPRSPYSASKACSDHLVRSWYHTYGLPIVITNCSNNYGPYQFPEKLIPLTILKALNGQNIPLYGDGSNVRDWLYVDDHVDAIIHAVKFAKTGETYCIGGKATKTNFEVIEEICIILDKLRPKQFKHNTLIKLVPDRPGHDERYAIDITKIKTNLNWSPKYSFKSGLKKTVTWYLNNLNWCNKVLNKSGYRGNRIGL